MDNSRGYPLQWNENMGKYDDFVDYIAHITGNHVTIFRGATRVSTVLIKEVWHGVCRYAGCDIC